MCFFLAVVDCGNMTAPANGQVDHTAGTTFGQTATYSCNTGYNLVGDSTRMCQAEEDWSGSAPTCEGVLLKGDLFYMCMCTTYNNLSCIAGIFHRAIFSQNHNLLNHKNVQQVNFCRSKFLKFIW